MKTAPQIIKASWFTPRTLYDVSQKNPFKKVDYVKQGYKPTSDNMNGVLTVFEDMPLAYYDLPTANKQIFQKRLWESLAQNPDVLFRLNQGRNFWGEPFHADSLEIMLPQVSHKVQSFYVADNGLIRGNVAVLDTPNGNIIYSLSKDGWVGISSRGFGSLEDAGDPDQNQIVSSDDYIHVSWDFVGVPAVKEAMATIAQHVKSFGIGERIASALKTEVDPELRELATILQSGTSRKTVVVDKPIKSAESAPEMPPENHGTEFSIEERDDGFWIEAPKPEEGEAAVPFEQGPYATRDEAAEKLAKIAMLRAQTITVSSKEFGAYAKAEREFELPISITSSVGGKKTAITSMLFKFQLQGIPKVIQGDDGLFYIKLDDKMFGPFNTQEEAEAVLKQNAPSVRSSDAEVGDDMKLNVVAKAPVQSAETDPKKPVKSADEPNLDGGEALDDTNADPGMDDAEASDRAEFTEMVILELADALSSTSDEYVEDETYEDLPDDGEFADLDKLNASKEPVKSAEGEAHSYGLGDTEPEPLPPGKFNYDVLSELRGQGHEGSALVRAYANAMKVSLGQAMTAVSRLYKEDAEDDQKKKNADYWASSSAPVKSAEEPEADLAAESDEDFGDEDLYFPTDDMGDVTVDESTGTITVAATGPDGESMNAELRLEDGYLTEAGSDEVDLDGEAGSSSGILPGGSIDLFAETNGDVSAAVDRILGLPSETDDSMVIDLTEGEEEPNDLAEPEVK